MAYRDSKFIKEASPQFLDKDQGKDWLRDELSEEEIAQLSETQKAARAELALKDAQRALDINARRPEVKAKLDSYKERSGQDEEEMNKVWARLHGTETAREKVARAQQEAAEDILRNGEVSEAIGRHNVDLAIVSDAKYAVYETSIDVPGKLKPDKVLNRELTVNERERLKSFFSDETITTVLEAIDAESQFYNRQHAIQKQTYSDAIGDIKTRAKQEWVQDASGEYSYALNGGESELLRAVKISQQMKRRSGNHQLEDTHDSEAGLDFAETYTELKPLAERVAIIAYRLREVANPNNPKLEAVRQDFILKNLLKLDELFNRYEQLSAAKENAPKSWLRRILPGKK